MSSNKIYGNRANGEQQGDVYTLPYVVSFMLDEVGYKADRDLSRVSIFEPSCGKGDFVIEITSRLYLSSIKFGFDFETAFKSNVYASDIDEEKMNICINRISSKFHISSGLFCNFFVEDFLLSHHSSVDIVVGNPPYIRYEEIPEKSLALYKSAFQCFYYRTDIYVLFYEKSLLMLKQGGKHCFICSNRWMKNTYGIKLRKLIGTSFQMEKIIDMESIQAFQEDVLAYPSITLIANSRPSRNVEYCKIESPDELYTKKTSVLQMPYGGDWAEMFTKQKYANFQTIQEQGFRIGIGVATGSDSIFVSKCLKGMVEDELLLPCINAQNLKNNQIKWDGRYLLTPYDKYGSLVNLELFPKAQKYLNLHFETLSNRHKAKKNPKRWYTTIDKIDRNLLYMPKVLLPDMSGNSYVFVDDGHFYPQHNIYYITGGTLREMKILAAFLMSAPIRGQLEDITNHMNGGYARWQSQYLKRLRLPVLSNLSETDSTNILSAYEVNDIDLINTIVRAIIDEQESSVHTRRQKGKVHELTLNFEYA